MSIRNRREGKTNLDFLRIIVVIVALFYLLYFILRVQYFNHETAQRLMTEIPREQVMKKGDSFYRFDFLAVHTDGTLKEIRLVPHTTVGSSWRLDYVATLGYQDPHSLENRLTAEIDERTIPIKGTKCFRGTGTVELHDGKALWTNIHLIPGTTFPIQ